MKNPFYVREIPLDAPFCNREKEIKDLVSHGKNRMNVVMYSPRRYGKTSLAKRVMHTLDKNMTTIYVDFFGVSSVEEIAERIASKTYQYTYARENVFKKAARFFSSWRPVLRPDPETGVNVTVEMSPRRRGMAALDDVFESLGKFSAAAENGCYIVFDEFQEITEISDSSAAESVMRTHIQKHSNISYLFIGSRRRILLDMFNQKKRPFYQSAMNYPLKPLEADALTVFLRERFTSEGKKCPKDVAFKIAERINGYPYYAQKIAYLIYEISGKTIDMEDYYEAFKQLLESEKALYEAFLRGLSRQQITLLEALAKEPTGAMFSSSYMSRHRLGSVGGIQGALQRLVSLDYIEEKDGIYLLVDPIFALWLSIV